MKETKLDVLGKFKKEKEIKFYSISLGWIFILFYD